MVADCPALDLLSAWSIGKLDEDSAPDLERHIFECPDCLSKLDSLVTEPDPVVEEIRRPVLDDAPAQERFLTKIEAIAFGGSTAAGNSHSAVSTLPWLSGSAIGPYEILGPIGVGGMGSVYRARHILLNRIVALKTLCAERLGDPAAVSRFLREMQSTGVLDHPNIVRASDAGIVEGTHYLVMELVEGLDLAKLVERRGPLPVADACEIIRQAAEGLEYASRHGLVHRDIKPSNLMLAEGGRVKLLDLGLALLRCEQSASEGLTQSGHMLGTPDFMAPEQAFDTHDVDARADLYSLGCTLFYLLSGRAPFHRPGERNVWKTLAAHAGESIPSIRDIRRDIPTGMAAVLRRLLAKQPADRYATAANVAVALEPFAKGSHLSELLAAATCDQPPMPKLATPTLAPRKSRSARTIAIGALVGSILLAWQIVIRIRDPEGRETKIELPKGSTAIIEEAGKVRASVPALGIAHTPQPFKLAGSEPLRPGALVTRPAKLAGVQSWTIETRAARGAWTGDGVAYSPDGRLVAVGRLDGTIRLHDSTTGTLSRALVGHRNQIWSLAFSPDGKILASGSHDRTARVWDVATGRSLATLHGYSERVSSVAFSPDGKTLASGCEGMVKLNGGTSFDELGSITTSAWSLAFSPDGKTLATGSYGTEGKVRIWDLSTLKPTRTLDGKDPRPVRSLAFSPDGKILAAGTTLVLWDIAAGTQLRTVPLPEWNNVAFSPNGRFLARAGAIWDLQKNALVRSIYNITECAWSPDGSKIAGANGVWEAASGQPLFALETYSSEHAAGRAAWSPDGSKIASTSLDGLRIWEPATARGLRTFTRPDRRISTFAWSPDGRKIAVGWGGPSGASFFDVETGALLLDFSCSPEPYFLWSPDGRILVDFDQRQQMRLLDAESAALLQTITGKTDRFGILGWSTNGKTLAYMERGECRFYDVESGKAERHIPWGPREEARQMAWSPDGKVVALIFERKVQLYDGVTFTPRREIDNRIEIDSSVAWSPDGATIAVANMTRYGEESVTGFWEAASDRLQRTATHRFGYPQKFSPDLQMLASSWELQTAITDAATGQPLLTAVSLPKQRMLFISPDGHYRGPRQVERELIYVVETDAGQEILTPDAFAQRFGWKNDPDRVGIKR